MKNTIQVVVLVATFIVLQFSSQAIHAGEQKAVLITGASTGIGRHLAEALAADGHLVYAGARKDEDLASLDAIDNITAVRLDVTSDEQVDAVVAMIEESGSGLWALVNNAGIFAGGDGILVSPLEDQMFVFAVNVEGVLRTTIAFAPLVIESKGRIVTTGSIAGTLSGVGCSAYCGSKHAIEAFTDALAGELAESGVKVSVVEPGNYKSNIRRTSAAKDLENATTEAGEVTPEMQATYEAAAARELAMKDPDEVTAAFQHALFSDDPLLRYMVVPNAEEQGWTIGKAIAELTELNTWGPYSYSRDELVAMLDATLNPQPEASD